MNNETKNEIETKRCSSAFIINKRKQIKNGAETHQKYSLAKSYFLIL